MSERQDIERISEELMCLLGTGTQVEPFSHRYPNFNLKDAYDVVSRVGLLRRARGESLIGRKIGFTNRSVWGELGISGPVWNYVFDSTVRSLQRRIVLSCMPEPRIEPELVLHLAKPPAIGMTTRELLECIDWIAPGFELVYSIFPAWAFTAADAAAAYGVHGALVVGEKLDVSGAGPQLLVELSSFDVKLMSDLGISRESQACNVLGGPLDALRFLVEEIARYPSCEPLRAGELVTTGTLTEAMPASAGQNWTVHFKGINLTPLQVGIE